MKRTFTITIITAVIIVLISLVILILIRNQYKKEKWKWNTSSSKNSVVFVSFAGGDKIHYFNQQLQLQYNKKTHQPFTKELYITDEQLKKKTNYMQVVPKIIRDGKRGYGWWIWKPFLIFHLLNYTVEREKGILVYLDSGAYFKKSCKPLIDYLLNSSKQEQIFFKNFHTNISYCKCQAVSQILNHDSEKIALFNNIWQVDASFMILRNTSSTRNLIKSWLDMCLNPNWLTDLPSEECKESSQFHDHRHDQCLLSLAIFLSLQFSNEKYNTYLFEHSSKYDWIVHHRRRSL